MQHQHWTALCRTIWLKLAEYERCSKMAPRLLWMLGNTGSHSYSVWQAPFVGHPPLPLVREMNCYDVQTSASKRTMATGFRFPKYGPPSTWARCFIQGSMVFLVHFPPVNENIRTMSQNTCPSQWNCIHTQIECIWCDVVLWCNCAMRQCHWFGTSGTNSNEK